MKKVLMLLLLIFGLACAGAGYYLFYYKPEQERLEALNQRLTPEIPISEEYEPSDPAFVMPEIMDYYVNEPTLGVREQPDRDGFVHRLLYRGEPVFLYEKQQSWGRLTPFYVYEEGGPEVAEWIPLDGLVVDPPVITPEERRETVLSYIMNSDDLDIFQTMFIQTTDRLLSDKTCVPGDFKELGGWVRSVRYQSEDVYFVYCGGLNQANKIYLNAQTGAIFYQ